MNRQSPLATEVSALASTPGPLRIALYSHDTMGLGHTRRNLLIAQSLSTAFPQADILLVTGTRLTGSFSLPKKVDCLTLPSLHKDQEGKYGSKHLGLSLEHLIQLRGNIIQSALQAFAPDVFIVDNVPRGAVNELDTVLEQLAGSHTKLVLGLRDVLDEPEAVWQQWRKLGNQETIQRYFHAVWIYGDPMVYNTVRAYELSESLGHKTHFVGYLDQRERLRGQRERLRDGSEQHGPSSDMGLPQGRLALCLVGGGQDGQALAEAFAAAALPEGMVGLIVTGPYMPAAAKQYLHSLASPNLRIVEFVEEPTLLLQQAERVVAMGGYNTVMELLSFEKHALVVPRIKPRLEQLIRAERLQELGLLQVLQPEQLSPQAISAWLAQDLGAPPAVHEQVDMGGLGRIPGLVQELLQHSKQEIQYA